MKNIEIYIKPSCPFCQRALALLDGKGLNYTVYDISHDPAKQDEMIERAEGRSTVPQIFIGGQGIGGCDDLHLLESQGQLDSLLHS